MKFSEHLSRKKPKRFSNYIQNPIEILNTNYVKNWTDGPKDLKIMKLTSGNTTKL